MQKKARGGNKMTAKARGGIAQAWSIDRRGEDKGMGEEGTRAYYAGNLSRPPHRGGE